jgi:hypothetical protein
MKELCVQISGWRDKEQLEHLTYLATMVCPVRNDVQEHFLSFHCSCITVSETETYAFGQLDTAGVTGVALVPCIGLGHRN